MRIQVRGRSSRNRARTDVQSQSSAIQLPGLQEVLARHGSSQDLKGALRALVDEGSKLELDETGLRALADELGRLQVGCTSARMPACLPAMAQIAQDARLPPPPLARRNRRPPFLHCRRHLRMAPHRTFWTAWSWQNCC